MGNAFRSVTDLSGLWRFAVPDGPAELRQVPGSYDCVGDSVYVRSLSLTPPAPGRRLLLCFEGIAYEGALFFNGSPLGSLLPYSVYEFDITDRILPGENEIRLELKDLNAVFGPSEGWKSYSGVIRPVFLTEVPETRITDAFFTYELAAGYGSAKCTVPCRLSGDPAGLALEAELFFRSESVCKGRAASGSVEMDVSRPRLWSPDSPDLYTLEVRLLRDGTVVDQIAEQVGFRDLKIQGSRFLLNGEDFFFLGVCRHDLWDDRNGFTMTDEMIEQDLRMIKAMGANYVRLVHYPHDRRVVAAADRIGLFVSEEPGLWWNDLSDTQVTQRALAVLENVILRDRNRPSVAFWLSFNECEFNEQFLRDAIAVARRCDPTRLISGANCNDTHETKRIFDACDVDFYTLHPYGTAPDHCNGETLEKACRVLSGKPVIFTEWGGYYVVDNPHLFTDFFDTMVRLHRNKEPEPVLAGMSYWQWQDICEYQRGLPACKDGVLTEGLVTMAREPKQCFYTFQDLLRAYRNPLPQAAFELQLFGGGSPDKTYVPLSLPKQNEDLWKKAKELPGSVLKYHWKKQRRMTFGPALPRTVTRIGALDVRLPEGPPTVVFAESGAVTVPVDREAKALWFIGQCTFGKGYPVSGERGEPVGCYRLRYADGSETVYSLRNGLETATVFGLVGPTAFDPRAAHTVRAFTLSFDKNWEIYHAGLLRVPVDPGKTLISVTAEVSDPAYALLLYGVSAEL